MLTPEEVAEIRERADKATPGLWRVLRRAINLFDVLTSSGAVASVSRWSNGTPGSESENNANAAFIAAARADVPALCDTVDALRADNERLREVVDAARTHDHVVLIDETGGCGLCDALAALDAGKEEG